MSKAVVIDVDKLNIAVKEFVRFNKAVFSKIFNTGIECVRAAKPLDYQLQATCEFGSEKNRDSFIALDDMLSGILPTLEDQNIVPETNLSADTRNRLNKLPLTNTGPFKIKESVQAGQLELLIDILEETGNQVSDVKELPSGVTKIDLCDLSEVCHAKKPEYVYVGERK